MKFTARLQSVGDGGDEAELQATPGAKADASVLASAQISPTLTVPGFVAIAMAAPNVSAVGALPVGAEQEPFVEL